MAESKPNRLRRGVSVDGEVGAIGSVTKVDQRQGSAVTASMVKVIRLVPTLPRQQEGGLHQDGAWMPV
jgi:hypothetical protein